MVWMLVALLESLIHAERVNAPPMLIGPALRYCDEPLSEMPCPMNPPTETAGTPDVAGYWPVLSAYGNPLSFRCQTRLCAGAQTAPFVVEAGGLVAAGLPQ